NAVLLNPLPFPEQQQLLRLGEGARRQAAPERDAFSFPDYKDLQAQAQTFTAVAAFLNSGTMLTGDGADAERVFGADVSPEYFAVLGVQPELGRVFTGAEDHENSGVVVISHALWQRRFGGNQNILGQQLKMGNSNATIIGVMPAGFEYPVRADHQDFWEPLNDRPLPGRDVRDDRSYRVIARIKPGFTEAQARAELDTISRRLEQQYPNTNTNIIIGAATLHDDLTRDVRPALLLLLGAVGLVLLIACANVANLLLARATARQKEIAIRTALGASRWRVVRQLLIESLLLAFAGGGIGLLLALWGTDLLVAASPASIPRVEQVGLDIRVLTFTLLLSTLTGIVFGLVPALHASKLDLTGALKEGGRGATEGLRRNRARSVLVITEVALSLMLLVGAGLLIKSFVRLLQTDPGFDPNRVVLLDIPLSRQRYGTPEKQATFFNQLIERTRGLPGVASVGLVDNVPLGTSHDTFDFQIAGHPPFSPGQKPEADGTVVSPGYFEALKIPLRQGRLFTEQDTKDSPRVILISEELARRYFAGENPIGQRIILDPSMPQPEIVGVVGDAHRRNLETAIEPEFYTPYAQLPQRRMNLVVRMSANDPAGMIASLRGAVRDLDKEQTIWQTRTLDQMVAASIADRRFNMMLIGLFALVALILASVGIYGVVAYSVTQRTHEIGIRLALGAQIGDVLKLILKQGMLLVLIGLALGLLASFFLTRLMSSLLFGISATDPATFIIVAALLTIVALLACYLPARRAMKVDPMVALRYE
ncbi:MAG TPA: ABC transporter permease, partial [Pyrinomonadaceae bacterium]|nr:ABC transporter permease [Pyrinomonadaceae bacterium]